MANQRRAKRASPTALAKGAAGLSRSEFVYQQILDAIADGRLRDKPLREASVAKKLGVSRTPVRESIQRLRERGLLTLVGRSLVVATLGEREALELYAIREILEGASARFAAERASAEDVAILRRTHSAYIKAHGDVRQAMQLNWRFHRVIHEAAHNRFLLQTINGMHDLLLLLHSTSFREVMKSELADSQHLKIIDAIEHRDPDAAEKAAREHVRTAVGSHYDTIADDQPPRWVDSRDLLLD